ncbi:hypothetical protein Tco_0158066 [Tanacetum coccineum]
MDLHDEIASRKGKSNIDSSSTKADNAGKQPTLKPNTKTQVKRKSKEVIKEKPHVKPKAALVKCKRVVIAKVAHVKSNVRKRKRLDKDVAPEEERMFLIKKEGVKKSTKGKKKGVVSKSKKWKHVSDYDSSSEEEKVSKPKKLSKMKKQVSESSSSSEDEKRLKKKKKKRVKQG